ncbi:hypothetical protein BJX99DRAFT_250542 [Aspergillus californicus]
MPPRPGKAIGDPGNDDYVAQVLAKEARDSSLKYSTVGMEAYVPRRPTGSAPKPNTRFLRHIIKETDNHNMALKRKEERESRERMRQLRAQAPSSSQTSSKDNRHRPSQRSDDRDPRREKRDGREDRHRSHYKRPRSRSPSPDRDRPRTSRRRHGSRDRHDDRYKRSRKSHRHQSYSRSRSRSPQSRDLKSRDRHRRRRRRSRSRTRSPETGEMRKETRSPRRNESLSHKALSRKAVPRADSDPLEDLVGPLPKNKTPIRSRGRGAYRPNSSNIDAHFASDYDPALDVQPETDGPQTSNGSTRRPVAGLMTGDDDWELALEVLRDRNRWKQRGEDRLREAGFNNDIVERWKSNPSRAVGDDEGRLENVKWSSKNEGREWDRGKFVDDDGHVDVKVAW